MCNLCFCISEQLFVPPTVHYLKKFSSGAFAMLDSFNSIYLLVYSDDKPSIDENIYI